MQCRADNGVTFAIVPCVLETDAIRPMIKGTTSALRRSCGPLALHQAHPVAIYRDIGYILKYIPPQQR